MSNFKKINLLSPKSVNSLNDSITNLQKSTEDLLKKLFRVKIAAQHATVPEPIPIKQENQQIQVLAPRPVDYRAKFLSLSAKRKSGEELLPSELWGFAIALVMRVHRATQMFYINPNSKYYQEKYDASMQRRRSSIKTESRLKATGISLNDFKVSDYAASKTIVITPETRRILDKARNLYTMGDLEIVTRLCTRIKSFQKYAPALKKRLIECMQYSVYGAGRVIVKQGHPAKFFYFVINGTIQVFKTEKSAKIVLCEMNAGDSFGELAIINNVKRTASVSCKVTCEFFMIGAEDFLDVLKATNDEDTLNKHNFFKNISIFGGMTPQNIQQVCDLCVKKDTAANEIMIKECEISSSVFFLRKGTVRIVRIVPFLKKFIAKDKFILEPTEYTSDTSSDVYALNFKGKLSAQPECKIIHKLLCISLLETGSYFGEECLFMKKGDEVPVFSPYTIITCEACEIFRISRSEFLKIVPPFVISSMESRKQLKDQEYSLSRIQNTFLEISKWLRFKKTILKDKLIIKVT